MFLINENLMGWCDEPILDLTLPDRAKKLSAGVNNITAPINNKPRQTGVFTSISVQTDPPNESALPEISVLNDTSAVGVTDLVDVASVAVVGGLGNTSKVGGASLVDVRNVGSRFLSDQGHVAVGCQGGSAQFALNGSSQCGGVFARVDGDVIGKCRGASKSGSGSGSGHGEFEFEVHVKSNKSFEVIVQRTNREELLYFRTLI